MIVDISNIRHKLGSRSIDLSSDEENQIAELLTEIYWELDYLEDDSYFDIRR